jgi:hypothetical protein
MRIETVNGRKIVCGHIYPKDELAVGQTWAQADGGNRVVVIRELDERTNGALWVKYGEHGNDRTLEKDWFTFQTRYCRVIED